MKLQTAVLTALLLGFGAPAVGAQEDGTEATDPLLERVDELLKEARAEIREFRQADGQDDDPEHPGRRWAEELWQFRQDHPGTPAADKATTEAVHFMIHAAQAQEAVARALTVADDDGAWPELIHILFEAAGETKDYEPFIRQAEALAAFEFDAEKRAALQLKVVQAHWVTGDFASARAALKEISDLLETPEWLARIAAAREELGHPEIRNAVPAGRSPRDLWQRPGRVMEALAIGRGGRVADIGSGGGYFSLILARRAGPTGRVYAVDIDEDSLERLSERAAEHGLENIQTVLGADDDPRLPAGELDSLLIVDTYHEMKGFEGMLRGMFEALKPGGRLVILDIPAELGLERTVYQEKHRIPVELVVQEAAAAGFRLWSVDPEFVRPAAGRPLYLVVFRKPPSDES